MINDKLFLKSVPSYVFKLVNDLTNAGFEAYLVGGSVRDLVIGRLPKDYDIGTNALPEDICKIFPKSIMTGAKFGSIIVLVEDDLGETMQVDVTTYRIDEEYIAGRWPSKVTFTRNIKEDLSRRDFTMNAIAIDLAKGETYGNILDPFEGREDIKNKLIRAVGNAKERFREDALRIIRACRFASVLGFTIDKDIFDAIPEVITMVDNLSAERIRDEFLKIIYKSPKPSVGIELLRKTGVLKIWMNELLEGIGVVQPEYHADDVYNHSLKSLDMAEDSVKLAALFHDIGKARTWTKDDAGNHFYRHDVVSSEMATDIMKRLKFSKKEIEYVATLIRWHMFYFPYDEKDFLAGKQFNEKDLEKNSEKQLGKWRDGAIRRFVKNVGGEEAIDDLIKLRIADATANPKAKFDAKEVQALQERIAVVRAKDMALKVTDLDVTGHDLQEIGVPAGPQIGKILNELLEMVVEDPTVNDKKRLLEEAKKMKNANSKSTAIG